MEDEKFTEDRYYEIIDRTPFTEGQIKKLSAICESVFLTMLHRAEIPQAIQNMEATNRILKWLVGIGSFVVIGLISWIKSNG